MPTANQELKQSIPTKPLEPLVIPLEAFPLEWAGKDEFRQQVEKIHTRNMDTLQKLGLVRERPFGDDRAWVVLRQPISDISGTELRDTVSNSISQSSNAFNSQTCEAIPAAIAGVTRNDE